MLWGSFVFSGQKQAKIAQVGGIISDHSSRRRPQQLHSQLASTNEIFSSKCFGPLGGQGAQKRVKVDISRSEKLVFEPVVKEVIINYSDLEEHSLLYYPLEEVLVEKLRCTIQRLQPRGYYDIWYLLEEHEMDIDFYVKEFIEKCKAKGVDPTSFHVNLAKRIPQYKGRWAKSMNDQIQDLPPFDEVAREINRHLKKFEV